MAERNASGYSGTPLVKKLGIKEGMSMAVLNAPDGYWGLLGDLPDDLTTDGEPPFDFIHFFTKERVELEQTLPRLRADMAQNGMMWISWPKKASRVETDITEDVVRAVAFANRLVDVKVAAVDNVWSGLKLVIRMGERKERG